MGGRWRHKRAKKPASFLPPHVSRFPFASSLFKCKSGHKKEQPCMHFANGTEDLDLDKCGVSITNISCTCIDFNRSITQCTNKCIPYTACTHVPCNLWTRLLWPGFSSLSPNPHLKLIICPLLVQTSMVGHIFARLRVVQQKGGGGVLFSR